MATDIRKTDEALAAYLVDEAEASVVRRVFEMYTVDGLSIAEITRKLNREGIPPRKASRWERSVVWGILRNPAYRGVACFGKTRLSARTQKRPQRRRGVTTHTAGHHLKSCLADGYPFVFGFVVYESFEKNKKGTWKTGIMPIPNRKHEQPKGGHAVMAVGYDDRRKAALIRNSWETDWSIAGYFRMP